jgi:hypothetical protein
MLAAALVLLLAACGGKMENVAGENGASGTANAVAPAAPGSDVKVNNDANFGESAGGPLTKYVGKHPSEAVDGTRFLDDPMVTKAVAATVSDPTIRNFVIHYNGPDAPIVLNDGRVLAWGCERHNCGYHNWSVAIIPDGSSAEVCFYHNDDSADGPATWYLPDGKTEKRSGNCPSD